MIPMKDAMALSSVRPTYLFNTSPLTMAMSVAQRFCSNTMELGTGSVGTTDAANLSYLNEPTRVNQIGSVAGAVNSEGSVISGSFRIAVIRLAENAKVPVTASGSSASNVSAGEKA